MTSGQFINANEAARLNALRDLNILDTPPSESFDRLTRMASRLLGASVSTISLTDGDRQWFKSKVGVDLSEIPRDQAPCHYAIKEAEVFVVEDLAEDERFKTSPLVQAGIRFYAGAPLVTRSGFGLGTICIVDERPRTIGPDEEKILEDLAGMVMAQIEIQNMIGRIDATSGFANQHKLYEDIEEQAVHFPGRAAAAVAIEFMEPNEVAHTVRVLGSGHAEILTKRALQILQRALGNSTRVYHVGQMRCALLGDVDGAGAEGLVRRALNALEPAIVCDNVPVSVSPVVGRYDFITGETAPEDLLRRLMNAVDDARETSERCATYNPVQDHRKARSFALLNDFAAALSADDQLHLVYQPRVDLSTGRMLGVEALLRWNHPKLGNVPPGEFIPLIEQTALVRALTDWVAAAAIRQTVTWERQGLTIGISINVSARNLDEGDFAVRFLHGFEQAGLDPRRFELEFTESTASRDQASVVTQLQTLHDAGVAIAIDDFGTGYSNVAYIQKLPISVLKIDRSFVSDLANSKRDRKLVRSMIALARSLDYRVVAEGIETRDVFDLLANYGCDEGQGYFMARPMQAREIEPWLATRPSHRIDIASASAAA